MRGSIVLALRQSGWWSAKISLSIISMITAFFFSISWLSQHPEHMHWVLYMLFLLVGEIILMSSLLVKSIIELYTPSGHRRWMAHASLMLSIAMLLQVEIWLAGALFDLWRTEDDVNEVLTYADAVSASSLFVVASSMLILVVQCFRGARTLHKRVKAEK